MRIDLALSRELNANATIEKAFIVRTKTMRKVQAVQQLTAQQKIQQLAQQHGIVVHQHSQLDELGNMFTNLSGDGIELDETQWLLVEIGRAGILKGSENVLLHAQYLSEKA
jgi:hypothetical protein